MQKDSYTTNLSLKFRSVEFVRYERTLSLQRIGIMDGRSSFTVTCRPESLTRRLEVPRCYEWMEVGRRLRSRLSIVHSEPALPSVPKCCDMVVIPSMYWVVTIWTAVDGCADCCVTCQTPLVRFYKFKFHFFSFSGI